MLVIQLCPTLCNPKDYTEFSNVCLDWMVWEYQTTWPASWEICMQVKKQQLELDMEQQTGLK